METRGESLKKLRKAEGLSLEEISQKTKIHIRILRALEEDKMTMAPAYIKGLLKIYCGFLGVDPEGFIGEHAKEGSIKEDILRSSNVRTRTRSLLVRPHVNISVIKRQIKIKPIIFVICLLALAIAVPRFRKNISNYRVLRLKKVVPKEVTSKPEIPSLSTPLIGKPELGIRAKEDCWLEVKVDGKTIFRNVLKKGYFEHWKAKERIEFSLGNAGGVDVEVNGRLLPPLGRRGRVIKNIIITKEGLAVPE